MTSTVITGPWPRSGRRTRTRQKAPTPAVVEPSDDDLLRLGRALHGFIRAGDWYAVGAMLGGLHAREAERRRPLIFDVPLFAEVPDAAD